MGGGVCQLRHRHCYPRSQDAGDDSRRESVFEVNFNGETSFSE